MIYRNVEETLVKSDDSAEASWILQLRNDDPQAFRYLYLIYHKRLYAFAYSYFKNKELAEEIVHDTFVRVWENRLKVDPEKPFSSLIFTIAKRLILNTLRKKNHEQLYLQAVRQATTLVHNPTEDSISYADYEAIVRIAIEQLPEKRRLIFTLSRESHLTYAQIAGQLGISQKTVEAQMNKALQFIREYLHRYTEITLLISLLLIHW